jgi:DnaK suppressor protein
MEVTVTQENARFDHAFLEAKRRQLTELKAALQGTRASAASEEAQVNDEAGGEAREYGDDAQKLVTLELEGSLEARDTQRLVNVERALRKIDEGSYGLSDQSGEPIPVARLNAAPEAIYTLAEQEAFDKKR